MDRCIGFVGDAKIDAAYSKVFTNRADYGNIRCPYWMGYITAGCRIYDTGRLEKICTCSGNMIAFVVGKKSWNVIDRAVVSKMLSFQFLSGVAILRQVIGIYQF